MVQPSKPPVRFFLGAEYEYNTVCRLLRSCKRGFPSHFLPDGCHGHGPICMDTLHGEPLQFLGAKRFLFRCAFPSHSSRWWSFTLILLYLRNERADCSVSIQDNLTLIYRRHLEAEYEILCSQCQLLFSAVEHI